ncbi:hypothetical protein GCM10009565_13470 [Amycolatopsis albidoflavus]
MSRTALAGIATASLRTPRTRESPNAALGALDAPNVAFGAWHAPNVALGAFARAESPGKAAKPSRREQCSRDPSEAGFGTSAAANRPASAGWGPGHDLAASQQRFLAPVLASIPCLQIPARPCPRSGAGS